jgi:Glycine zipper 2TM domain
MIQGSRYAQITAVTLLLVSVGSVAGAADDGNGPTGMGSIERSIQAQDWTPGLPRRLAFEQRPALQQMWPTHASRKLIWGLVGAVAGAVVGYQVGKFVFPYDPDHTGAIVLGTPIGAVAGGAVGVWVGSK